MQTTRKYANTFRRYSIFLNELIEREKRDPLGKKPRPSVSTKVPTYQFVKTDVFQAKVSQAPRSSQPVVQALQREGLVDAQYQVVKLTPLVRLLSNREKQKALMAKHHIHPRAFQAFVANLHDESKGLPSALVPISDREWLLNQMIRVRSALQKKARPVLPVVESAAALPLMKEEAAPFIVGWLLNRYWIAPNSWLIPLAQRLEKKFLVTPSWRLAKTLHKTARHVEQKLCSPQARPDKPRNWKSTSHP